MKNDWWSCDGTGGDAQRTPADRDSNEVRVQVSRRGVLMGMGMAALGWATAPATALSQVAVGRQKDGNVLVNVFLRGGMDGLNVVVPYGDDDYARNRPSLGFAKSEVRDLDGFFGLNPALDPLLPSYKDGEFAIVQAIGSFDQTRSHFEAMNAMERGLPRQTEGAASGWLARHLAACPVTQASPLRAVAFGSVMPDSLRGATDAISMQSLDEFRIAAEDEATLRKHLGGLYAEHKDAMAEAGRETLEVLDSLQRLDPRSYKPANGAKYPESDLGRGLRQVAFLVRAGVGLEVAALDKGGWDTHVAQGKTAGWLTLLLTDLSQSLAAFLQDLGPEMKRVTLVVQTEFGRRVGENAALGTDHGRASVMFLAGGGVRGGKVYGEWPGLAVAQQEGPGDLRVTTDYRNVLAEVLQRRTAKTDLGAVFPGLSPKMPGIVT